MAFGRSMRPSKTARGARPGAAPSRGGPRLQRGMGPGGAPPAGTMASLRAQQAGGAPPPPSGGGSMMNMQSPAVRPGGNGATNNAAMVSGSRPTPMPAVGSTMGGSSMPMPTPPATAGAGSMSGSMIGPKQMGFNKGGKVKTKKAPSGAAAKGYGMARGGRACKIR